MGMEVDEKEEWRDRRRDGGVDASAQRGRECVCAPVLMTADASDSKGAGGEHEGGAGRGVCSAGGGRGGRGAVQSRSDADVDGWMRGAVSVVVDVEDGVREQPSPHKPTRPKRNAIEREKT
eukprot:1315982-Rhodomonas_salina.1